MKKLQTHELMTLRHVYEQRRVCIGEITSTADAVLAEMMATLAKRKLLMVECLDDGPVYSCAPAGILIAEKFND